MSLAAIAATHSDIIKLVLLHTLLRRPPLFGSGQRSLGFDFEIAPADLARTVGANQRGPIFHWGL
jgi:hypothetical protein